MNQQAFVQSRSNGSTPTRVLMADPDPSLPPVYREPLLREGFELARQPAGWSASLDSRRVPDVLVLEPQMPWGGGDGVLAIMDESPDLTVPVMVLTSCRDPHVLKGVDRFPISVYHVKPLRRSIGGERLAASSIKSLAVTMPIRSSRLPCSEATKTSSTRLKQQSGGSKTASMAGARTAENQSPGPAWTPSLMPRTACAVLRNGKQPYCLCPLGRVQ